MAITMYGKSLLQGILHCVACSGLLAGVVCGQADPAQAPIQRPAESPEVVRAIAKLKLGEAIAYNAQVISEAGAREAIPDLEEQFAHAPEFIDKAKVAQVLLALGDEKEVYWDYLAERAGSILKSDAPNPMQFDAEGKGLPGLSPAWIAWAKAHNQPPGAGEDAIYVNPGMIGLLGMTRDPRAIPLLRQALSFPNYMIQTAGTMGLAEMQDKTSIPLIIEACKKAPAEAAEVMARSLVYFDSPEAQKAVDTYIPKERAQLLREGKAKGEGPLHRSPSDVPKP